MTQEEFFAYANLPQYADNVNVWYSGNNPGTILGLSIPVLIIIDGQTIDLTSTLEIVQEITIPQPSGLPIILSVNTRAENQSSDGTRYYLFLVDQITTQEITGPIAIGELYFSPNIDIYEFNVSPYNVLGGSIEENRESTYLMKADKSTAGSIAVPVGYSGPANIYALLSGSAEIATIQDSNYSITGWKNARYEGSKTNERDYQSPPSLTGAVFQGSNFPITVPLPHIQNQISSSNVLYDEYFYAGTEETPGYSAVSLNYITSGSATIQSNGLVSNFFFIDPITPELTNLTGSINIGDLIKVTNRKEIMKVLNIGSPPGLAPGTLILDVQRNINNVSSEEQPNVGQDNQTLQRVKQVQIFEVENNRLNGTVRGYMVVQNTGEILVLNNNGYVVDIVE